MFRNYFKTAFRNFARNKVYSCINVAGLSLGLACAMLIMLYVKDEVSFDRFHRNVNNIYRIVSKSSEHNMVMTGPLQGPRFSQNVPGIRSFVRIRNGAEDIKKGNYVQSQDLVFVDSNFFSVFTFPLLSGDAKTCLTEPHSIVLTEDIARRQFGTTDALGKIVLLKDDSTFVPYKVTAVAKRCPQNSSIQFEALLPIKISDEESKNTNSWFGFSLNTFVVLDDKANLQTVEKQMQSYYVSDAKPAFDALLKKHGINKGRMATYFLQPYSAMHLSTELPVNNNFGHLSKKEVRASNGLTNSSDPIYSYILSGIALFVLLIACINFINLTVARSVKRAKEIGIRKVVGGERKQLIFQFLGESFILCFIAFLMAVLLVELILPVFNQLSNKALAISYLFDIKLVSGYIVLFLLTGLLAGFYPALVLSKYNPVQTLYSRFQLAGKNYLQKSLVVLQFALASFLIIATFTIFSQFNYLTTEKLGYDDSNLVIVSDQMKQSQFAVFKNELMKSPSIVAVSPKNGGMWGTIAKVNGDSTIQFAYETVDETYIPLLKIPIVQGRNFSAAYPSDSSQSILVNEAFVRKAGWKNPIGQEVNFWYRNNKKYKVIGVVKDYHYQ